MSGPHAFVIAKLEEQKTSMLARLAGWSHEQVRFRALDGQWSGLEVVSHVSKVELEIIASMADHWDEEHRSVSVGDSIRSRALVMLFLTPVRVKAPAQVTSILPDLAENLEYCEARWTQARTQLGELLARADPGRRAVFQHPVSGWMTLSSTLAFLSAHITHHDYQLARLERAAGKRGRCTYP